MDIEEAYLKTVRKGLRRPKDRSWENQIISIMGPLGAGKTTLIHRLQKKPLTAEAEFYVEDGSVNPYLKSGFNVDKSFDADACQRWFLDQYQQFFAENSGRVIFLDQDPCAVGLVYSRVFFDAGLISENDYASHLEILIEIDHAMSDLSTSRSIFALETPTVILIDRIRQRKSSQMLSDSWVGMINSGFDWLYSKLDKESDAGFYRLNSSDLSPQEIEDAVLRAAGV